LLALPHMDQQIPKTVPRDSVAGICFDNLPEVIDRVGSPAAHFQDLCPVKTGVDEACVEGYRPIEMTQRLVVELHLTEHRGEIARCGCRCRLNAAQRLERRGSGGCVGQAVASESQTPGSGPVSRMLAQEAA